ncbi:hypothetical protein C7R94_27955, partial [Brevibacillus sp. NRRL NRS-603]
MGIVPRGGFFRGIFSEFLHWKIVAVIKGASSMSKFLSPRWKKKEGISNLLKKVNLTSQVATEKLKGSLATKMIVFGLILVLII